MIRTRAFSLPSKSFKDQRKFLLPYIAEYLELVTL